MNKFSRFVAACAAVLCAFSVSAETYYLAGTDEGSASAMIGTGSCGWTDTAGTTTKTHNPSEGNDYVVAGNGQTWANLVLRTPTVTGKTFGGDSLTLKGKAEIKVKVPNNGVVTIPNLIIDGEAQIVHGDGNQTKAVDGAITVNEGAYLKLIVSYDNGTTARMLDIRSSISGAGEIWAGLEDDKTAKTPFVKFSGSMADFTGKLTFQSGKTVSSEVYFYKDLPGDPAVLMEDGFTLVGKPLVKFMSSGTLGYTRGIALPDEVCEIYVEDGQTVQINGLVTGAAGFKKTGAGTLALASASPGLSGTITVAAGTLQLCDIKENALPNATVTVSSGATLDENGPVFLGRDMLLVTGEPSPLGVVSPAYGLTRGLAVGDSFLCSAPASWTNEAGDVGADCVGYKLGYYYGETYDETTFVPGAPTAFTYKHPENELGTTLDWTWRMKYRVQIADADLGGHTEVTDEWKFVGETVTLTATPDEGYVFAAWQGEGVTDAEKGQASIEHVVDRPIVLKPLFLPEGGTLVRAGESIHTAVANASADDVIVLAPGVHHLNGQTINLTKKLTIRGATGNPADVILNGDASATNNKFHGFNVTADATIADLTVSNTLCNVSRQNGGGIILTKGTVTNCVVTDCHIDNAWSGGAGIYIGSKDAMVVDCLVTGCNMSKYGKGGGIYNNGGKVLRTRIVGNVATGSDGDRAKESPDGLGVGLYQTEGTALTENCIISNNWFIKANNDGCVAGASVVGGEIRGSLIVGNRIDSGSTATADTPSTAGLEVSGASTRAVNCTVADNVAKGNNFVAGLNLRSGSVINCVVENNRNTAMAKDYDILGGGRGTWTNNRVRRATDITVGSGNLEADAVVFKDGTYELTGGSNAAGVGLVEDWMTGATDLTGKTRLRVDETSGETVVDAGALVWTPPPLRCLIRSSSAPVQHDLLSVTLTAEAVGETEGLVYYWDLDGDGKADRVGADLATIDYATATFSTLTFGVAVTNAAGLGVSASPVTFKLVPSTVYVDRASANPVWPYNTPQTAANDFVEACKVAKEADGITVRVADGTYPISARTSIDTAVTIIGESREGTILDGQVKKGILKLTRSGATVKNITFYRGVSASESAADAGGGVCLQKGTTAENCEFVGCTASNKGGCSGCGVGCDGGTVRDCIFRDTDLTGRSGVRIWGLGIYMDSGLVERCVFSDLKMGNIETGNAYDNFACGVYAKGGTIRGCLFRRCLITHSSGAGGFAAAVTLNGATMVNCTVVSNTATANAAVSLIKYNQSNPSKVVNCVIWDNVRPDGTIANYCGGYDGYEDDLTYCCTLPKLPDEHSIAKDPKFMAPAKIDGRLKSLSPCVQAGVYDTTCLDSDTLDLYGRKIVDEKGRVTMGCVRTDPRGLVILFQ